MSKPAETELFHQAVKHWWSSKKAAKSKKAQGGTRDVNLHGKTMDGFASTLRDFLVGLGVKPQHIFSGGHLTKTPSILPSYFRPSKNWDLIVLANSRFHPAKNDPAGPILYAAVEFKSQDKSIGNNQNNRLEESIGNAHDFWTTYAHEGFERQQPRPWLGYLFVGKYEPASDGKSVRISQPHFLAMQPFRKIGSDKAEFFAGPSYAERYRIFLKQSVGARLYDAGAFMVTDESLTAKKTNHRIPLPEFGPANFLRGLKAQILAHYPGAKVQDGTLASLI
jgi:Restriction endonuclease XhoI